LNKTCTSERNDTVVRYVYNIIVYILGAKRNDYFPLSFPHQISLSSC